jgi:hypothetical protein
MKRMLVAACAAVMAVSCGGGSGSGPLGVAGPPSAQSVAESSSDFPGMQKCPETGSYDNYLKQEQSKAPDQYTTDSKDWTDLKAAGANDGYVAAYAENSSDCAQFGSGTPSGKYAGIFAFRFKDSTSAAASYKTQAASFHLSDTDITNIQTAGGTVKQGATTGLGPNSIAVSFSLQGTTFYVALWQNKEFEIAMLLYNLPESEGPSTATKVNARVK